MTFEMVASGDSTYQVVLNEWEKPGIALLYVRTICGETETELEVGQLTLLEPNGRVIDAASGEPVEGATVQLNTVPGWMRRVERETIPNSCVAPFPNAPSPSWDQIAPENAGFQINPIVQPEVVPNLALQPTDENGHFAWRLPTGCWFMRVFADGYLPLVGPLVGSPAQITGLELRLTPLQAEPTLTPTAMASATLTATPPTSVTPVISVTATLVPTMTQTELAATPIASGTPTPLALETPTPTQTPSTPLTPDPIALPTGTLTAVVTSLPTETRPTLTTTPTVVAGASEQTIYLPFIQR